MGTGFTTRKSQLLRVQAGEEDAWRDFYEKYRGMIIAIGKTRNLSQEECNELQQNVMHVFWKRMEQFVYEPKQGKLRGFLSRIAHISAIKIYQKRIPPGETEALDACSDEDETTRQLMTEGKELLLEMALDKLKQRINTDTYETFHLSVIQERPIAEVAGIVRKTPNNIYNIRNRCMTMLKEIIEEYRANCPD